MLENNLEERTEQARDVNINKRFFLPFSSSFSFRKRKHVPCFHRVIETRVEVWENKNCCGNECFHSFFEFSQTFTSVCITRYKHGVHAFYFFWKTPRREKGKQLVNFDYQNVNSLGSRHHYVNSSCLFCVSIEL